MTALFEFQQVTKQFGRQTALDRVSLTGERGEVVALLGENGAGKTTALKILLGLIKPDGGSSRVLGLDSQLHGAEIRRRVGYMPDRPALYEWMTVAEIGWFAAGFYPLGYQQRYQHLIQKFELPNDKAIKNLSKGMQGKVSLALAMSHEPELLVLDEPTSGLDPLVRREFLESMIDVAAGGRTVLLSSHQMVEVERVADKIAIIRGGKLVLFESLDVLKNRVQEVIITCDMMETIPPDLPPGASLLGAQRLARQWQMLVRDLDELGAAQLVDEASHLDVEIRTPSLEQIFVVCMKSDVLIEYESPPDRVAVR
ncbi:ABC transporter ATP-binding protein [Schlesneria paludicola]|uniref:ABC transporter ATP-binding protein n=1 Tax=Schlesneria paludicola TaxID=360056 RepID=UPI00029A97CC|nr:ABC transporter ATP-binding protein [Schlesneria paludicola]